MLDLWSNNSHNSKIIADGVGGPAASATWPTSAVRRRMTRRRLGWPSVTACPRCRHDNAAPAWRCGRCGLALPYSAGAPDTTTGTGTASDTAARTGTGTAPPSESTVTAWDDTAILPAVVDDPEPTRRRDRRRGIVLAATAAAVLLAAAVVADISLAPSDHRDAVLSGPFVPSPPLPAPVSSDAPSAPPSTPTTPSTASTPSRLAPTTPKPTVRPSQSRPATTSAELAQARTIDGYLRQSAAARKAIGPAIAAIGACSSIPAAAQTLRNAAASRSRIVDRLRAGHVDAIPGGTRIAGDLARAMSASAAADLRYAAWGVAVQSGCRRRAAHTADFRQAQRDDAQATVDKRRFAAEWNPVARKLGLPAADPGQF